MLIHVVTNRSKGQPLDAKFADQVKAFTNHVAAARQYNIWCGELGFGNLLGLNFHAGAKNIYKCGDVDVELLTLELDESDGRHARASESA